MAPPIMEQIHGIDVSWMTHHGSPKDRSPNLRRSTFPVSSDSQIPRESSAPSPIRDSHEGADGETDHTTSKGNGVAAQPKPIPPRPGFTRESKSGESKSGSSPGSPSLSRKPSWFSNLSSKFAGQSSSPPPSATASSPTKDAELSVPKITPAKNAVLQHAAKHQGEGPYTPAPPRGTSQGGGGILHVFRRLSSSGAGQLGGPVVKGSNNHGLVERKVLNVDPHRERCPLEELHQAKLRRVAFCVDVEIAPMPKYAEGDSVSPKVGPTGSKTEKRKLVEKGEGEALKNPKGVEEQKEQVGAIEVSGEQLPKEPVKEGEGNEKDSTPREEEPALDNTGGNKKKEKKKRSEEERKARKEKKRKLAEANGQIPLEIHLDTDTSDPSAPTTPRAQVAPTTNPVRIYRRCCQLRETPILKKITEQLLAPSNTTSTGIVEKLDLTGYWMQVPDLVTLGDFLAVVPVKEVILENCGLTDEGLRVVLAGLLAVRKTETPRRRPKTVPDGLVEQGGVVERLVLKSNKIGPEGWKHLCLFIYMCRTLTSLDLADIAFPKVAQPTTSNGHIPHLKYHDEDKGQLDMYALLARSIGERLGGQTLELLNLSNTGLSHSELGRLLDGITKCGVRRLGLAHLDLDLEGLEHIKRYLTSGKCEGLDLGGNDLRDHCESLGSVLEENNTLWGLSLAECNLKPSSLCHLLPHLAKLSNFRFLDLSHNQELFSSNPSAVGILRRCLPKLKTVKRIHLGDCALKSEQLIALAEVIPEMDSIAHISFTQNPELTRLANADSEETQEEASALYASLLAAARLSPNLVCIDIDVPTDGSGEIVKALAKQIVAYCLRNMERLPLANGGAALGEDLATAVKDPEYPDVLQHLVGHDIMTPDGPEDEDMAPDDDYIVGGTGVAKALACCLNNRGDESSSQSAELIRQVEDGISLPKSDLPAAKAKDVSKHLLLSARKIRHRLHPALVRAKAMADKSTEERHTYQRLRFLQRTLDGIINRFEDEFPETKEVVDSAIALSPPEPHPLEKTPTRTSLSSIEAEREPSAGASDVEDETHFEFSTGSGKGSLSRQSSNLSLSSMALNREEGIALRTGHKFRYRWMLTSEQYHLLASTDSEELDKTPTLVRVINELLEELGNEELLKLRDEKGAVRVFKEHRQTIIDGFKQADPEYWARFVESQEKARANVMPQERAEAERGEVTVVDEVSESAVSD